MVGGLALTVGSAHASLLAYDNFSTYAASPTSITGQYGVVGPNMVGFAGSGVAAKRWTSNAAVVVTGGVLTQGANLFRSRREFATIPLVSSGTIYVRARLAISNAASGVNFSALELVPTINSDANSVRLSGADGGLNIIANGDGVSSTVIGPSSNAMHVWLIELNLNTKAGKVWLDPDTAAFNPTVGSFTFTAPSAFALNGINLATFGTSSSVQLDDLWVGTTLGDVGVTVAETTPPAIASLNPPDGSGGVYPGSVLVATFDEPIALTGGGSITITDTDNGSATQTITVTDSLQVTVSGNSLIINPPTNLAFNKPFEVVISSGTVQDTVTSPNVFPGTTAGQWTFSTAAQEFTAPVITFKNPADDASGVSTSANIVATFDQNILLASGGATTVFLDEDFEADTGGFAPVGTPNDWAWGTPNSDNNFGLTVSAGNGGSLKCWATNLGTGGTPSGTITVAANSILQGPDAAGAGIDLTSAASAELRFAAAVDAAASDTLEVLVKEVGSGMTLVTVPVTGLTPPKTANWATYGPFNISAAAGHDVYLEFRYAGTDNQYIGLYIDDLLITGVDSSKVITLRNLTSGINTVIPVSDSSQVSVSGATLTINPIATLTGLADYAVRIGSNTVRNYSELPFAGIANDTVWNFATNAVLYAFDDFSTYVASPTSINGQYGVAGPSLIGFATSGAGKQWTSTNPVVVNGGVLTQGASQARSRRAFATTPLVGTGTVFVRARLALSDAPSGVNFSALELATTLNSDANTVRLVGSDLGLVLNANGTGGVSSAVIGPASNAMHVWLVELNLDTKVGKVWLDPNLAAFNSSSGGFTFTAPSAFALNGLNIITAGTSSSVALDELRIGQTWSTIGVTEVSGPSDTFADWIGGYDVGGQTGVNQDPDGDGIDNGVENFFGTAPDEFSQGLIAGTYNAGVGTFTFTHPQGTLASDLGATYQWSKDLATFYPEGAGAGTTVAFLSSTDAGITTVTATITGTIPNKLFVRVNVTQN